MSRIRGEKMKENAKGNAKEKIRVLLAGKNKVVQDDFFST